MRRIIIMLSAAAMLLGGGCSGQAWSRLFGFENYSATGTQDMSDNVSVIRGVPPPSVVSSTKPE
ncbi:MAG: hypothetical protein WCW31_03380 [Patescibacteria group bacterium]|jgi:hypothetical protein